MFGDLGLQAAEVGLIYESLLGRAATADEVAAQLRATADWRVLLAAVAESQEYQRRLATHLSPAEPRVNIWHPDLAFAAHPTGSTSPDGEVVVGKDGWLFLVGGSNAVLKQHQPGMPLAAGWHAEWAETIATRVKDAARLGARLAMVVVPDKLSVLQHKLPPNVSLAVPPPACRLGGMGVLYPKERLGSLGEVGFLRTDTHLSLSGNTELARVVLEALDVDVPQRPHQNGVRYPSIGDLGRRFTPAILELLVVAGDLGAAHVIENNAEQVHRTGRHIGTRTVLANTTAPDDRVAVVFGDSYSLASAHYQGLGWFLAQRFAEVHVIWSPFGWDPTYLERTDAGVVVCETAERFVPQVPARTIDVEGLAKGAEAP